MAINKIIYNGGTLIDLTGDTVTADKLMQGYTAHDKTGTVIIGTATGGGTEAGTVYQDAQGYLVLDDEAGTHVNVTSLSVTENGTYTAPTGVAYSPVTVNVSGGGGGGGGGISTATLTYSGSSNTTPFNLYAPIITETYAEMSGVSEYLYASTNPQTVEILLYNGASYVHIDNTVTSISGDIEEDEDGYYFITGDCTVTIS